MKEIKNIVFYNHFHKGDIFLSRSFIKDMINKLNLNFYYLHYNGKDFFNDFKINCDLNLNELKNIDNWNCNFIVDETMYLNTWYNSCGGKYMTGCNLQTFYNLFKNYYNLFQIEIDSMENYIPSVDYSYFDIKVNYNLPKNKIILICNNIPLSGQSNTRNIDFIINELSNRFTNIIFLVTNQTNVSNNNIIETKNILKFNNLFEISHLSKFCDIIIGRSSGPYSFSLIRENIFNDKIKYISICSDEGLVDFGLKHYANKNKFNYINSNLNDEEILKLLIEKS